VKRYEGLFILNTAGKEEGIKDIIDHISADISAVGGKVEGVQKMDKRQFTRAADRKHQSGFYVNLIFQSDPSALPALRGKFRLNDDVFRVVFTKAGPNAVPNAGAPT
jgi:ribosomal protein S6